MLYADHRLYRVVEGGTLNEAPPVNTPWLQSFTEGTARLAFYGKDWQPGAWWAQGAFCLSYDDAGVLQVYELVRQDGTTGGQVPVPGNGRCIDGDMTWQHTTQAATKVWAPKTQFYEGDVVSHAGNVTKWLSLSRRCLIDHGTEQPTFWQSVKGLRNARRLGYIRSEEMRKRFVHKILSYIGVVLAAAVLDFMLTHAHAPAFATSLVIGYLAITEFVSILENMQHSDVEEAGAIAELARKKGGIVKPDEKGEE